jgi:5-methylcytosine-specific restriction endonuclease McrA
LRPISEELRVLRVTVGREFADDLARVKALLSHTIPDGSLEQVLHACIRRTIAQCESRRRGADRPRPRKTKRPPAGRGIPTAVRREVWRRDAGTCAFVATDGKRCGSNHQIEFHHIEPFARGGPPTVDNIEIRCKAHNRYAAEADFGREFMRSVMSEPARS